MRRLYLLPLVLALFFRGPAEAGEAPELSLPVDCPMGEICFIQNHFDRDPDPGFRDYACGNLGYDGHTGVDIRVADLPTMARGIAVIAAAPGRVKAVRDGMADIDIRLIDQSELQGRTAGNGVVIDHGQDWQTRYMHLRRDSLRVAVGDRVARGDVLGLIGMSGNAAFPHVHFSVRYRGRPVDPFAGLEPAAECGTGSGALWGRDALAAMPYTPSGILAAGFATRSPQWSEARRGEFGVSALRRDAPALVFWTSVFGGRAGDRIMTRMIAPDGGVMAENNSLLDKDKAQYFSFAGRKRRGDAWPKGVYRGEFKLIREIDGAPRELLSATREITLP